MGNQRPSWRPPSCHVGMDRRVTAWCAMWTISTSPPPLGGVSPRWERCWCAFAPWMPCVADILIAECYNHLGFKVDTQTRPYGRGIRPAGGASDQGRSRPAEEGLDRCPRPPSFWWPHPGWWVRRSTGGRVSSVRGTDASAGGIPAWRAASSSQLKQLGHGPEGGPLPCRWLPPCRRSSL